MPKRSRDVSVATATRILSVARSMFAQRGYADVSLDSVATAAEVTRGAVYHHFGSKRGLFEAVLATVQQEVGSRVAAAAAEVDEPWAQLEAGCLEFLRAALDDGSRRIMLIDAPSVLGWQEWRRLDEEHSGRLLAEGLNELADAGLLCADLGMAVAPMLSGAMNEAALWLAHSTSNKATEQARATLLALLRSLRA